MQQEQYYECLIYGLKSPVMNFFTYSYHEQLSIGDLIEVSLRNKNYKAIVWKKVSKPKFKTKPVVSVLMKSALSKVQIDLIEFISKYYFANIGGVLDMFLPKKLKDNKYNLEISEFEDKKVFWDGSKLHNLNEEQLCALGSLSENSNAITLLHGVTGSGKTEVYIHRIIDLLKEDSSSQFLIMVPEISLTPQMSNYFKDVFDEDMLTIYSSKLNKTEQQNIWKDVYSGKTKVVIGSRSSLFLPFKNLKMLVVDEEHDASYKQDMDPKYHVRNVVQWMNSFMNVSVVLGSATPSVETYMAAETGKINYVQLKKKASAKSALSYEVIDMKDEKKRGNWHYLSDRLVELITETLSNKEQVLLLHNRRGSANFLQCADCGEVEECVNCSISMTPHGNDLECHYCGFKKQVPLECSFCGSVDIKNIGVGVKALELELKKYFPKANVIRVDSDTNSRKNAHVENYEAIKTGKADIVVGTQAIATGLDVENVGLVGVINVDQHLNFPDFRANERSFQLLTQFAGRAGRGEVAGKVVFQVHQTDSIVLKSIVDESYRDYVTSEMEYRRMLSYPPFSRMTRLIYSNKDRSVVKTEVMKVESMLEKVNYARYRSGVPLIERKHGKFYHQIILSDLSPEKIISYLKLGKGWSIDRDPISMF